MGKQHEAGGVKQPDGGGPGPEERRYDRQQLEYCGCKCRLIPPLDPKERPMTDNAEGCTCDDFDKCYACKEAEAAAHEREKAYLLAFHRLREEAAKHGDIFANYVNKIASDALATDVEVVKAIDEALATVADTYDPDLGETLYHVYGRSGSEPYASEEESRGERLSEQDDRHYVFERDDRRRRGEALSYDERELRFHANGIIAHNRADNLAAIVARAYLSQARQLAENSDDR